MNHTVVRSFDQWKVAKPSKRFYAFLIDLFLGGFACLSTMIFWFPTLSWTKHWSITVGLLWIVVLTATQFFFLIFYKNTPGKKLLGLSVQPVGVNKSISM